jgi:hypothetical protein
MPGKAHSQELHGFRAQQLPLSRGDTLEVRLSYARSSFTLNSDSLGNPVQLARLDSFMTACLTRPDCRVQRICLTGKASIEGTYAYNMELSRKRALDVHGLLLQRYGARLDSAAVLMQWTGEDWDGLWALIEASGMPQKKEMLRLIRDVPVRKGRQQRMMEVRYGRPYKWMEERFFPALRRVDISVEFDFVEPPIANGQPETAVRDSFAEAAIPQELETLPLPAAEPEPIIRYERKSLFAVKTNLLYDLALTPGIELEIPLGRRWSVNAEYAGGWWLKEDWSFCWQILSVGLEGRYWLGDRTQKPLLTGWFVGAFAGGGYYDFQLEKDKGAQGEFYIMAGVSAGYAHRLWKDLRMEYSLGAGYFTMDYRRYTVHADDRELIKYGPEKRYSALMPLKAKVSLVWLLHYKTKKKGGVR